MVLAGSLICDTIEGFGLVALQIGAFAIGENATFESSDPSNLWYG